MINVDFENTAPVSMTFKENCNKSSKKEFVQKFKTEHTFKVSHLNL